jgi:hypothetical protein
MSQFFVLEPEPAGELGLGTDFVPNSVPPRVSRLEWVFDFLPDDDLIHRTPAYMVSAGLAAALDEAGLTGYEFREATVNKAPEFDEINPGEDLPDYRWLEVTGKPGEDDLGLDDLAQLVVSERALETLKRGRLDDCRVEPFPRDPS